ncbi:Deoxyribose-phosphate aldolase [Fasciolopsis buskii]|uniref:deoxyribose-phosphate aldolase n=1 Tax=Fasciolopsis buskii TaxID=27845 RepID=A0A8E0VK89_9TREM|nr:Deoxyribose-phosphate aldolase [Fasciolopsis buski]
MKLFVRIHFVVIVASWSLLVLYSSDVYEEVRAMRAACGDRAHMKTILAVGELGSYDNVYAASMTCMLAGADFIKTSTGKESVNATLPGSLVMARAIKDFEDVYNIQASEIKLVLSVI